jgi:hypothetical protein
MTGCIGCRQSLVPIRWAAFTAMHYFTDDPNVHVDQWRRKDTVNYTGRELQKVVNCAKVVLLSYNQIETFPLYFLIYVDRYLFVYTIHKEIINEFASRK